jgi:putative endonuclease
MWPFTRNVPSEQNLGRRGEELAARFLRKKGLKILGRNYRCPRGEADIIALDTSTAGRGGDTIVFVEVKARASDAYAPPEAAVDYTKQNKLRQVAQYYVTTRKAQDLPLRFDIVTVLAPPGGAPVITHLPDAF